MGEKFKKNLFFLVVGATLVMYFTNVDHKTSILGKFFTYLGFIGVYPVAYWCLFKR